MDHKANTTNKNHNKRYFLGLNFAWNGIVYFFKTQQNGRIQAIVAGAVIITGYLTGLTPMEWIAVIISIVMVLAAEMMNTAIEYLTDLVTPHYNIDAGRIKDIAAGAVLITALGAAIIGVWIFLPRLIEFIFGTTAGIA